ncbi:MAG: AI-2E family transporter [Bacteroidetes bacterium]|nr:MAG: AI-2E family transporter [Bacteroidota bacterium]
MSVMISNNVIRQLLILLFIILLAFVLFKQLQAFIPSFLGSYTLFVLLKKWMYILTGKYKWKKNLAATVLMAASFVVILLPIVMLINLMTSRIDSAIQHASDVIQSLEKFVHTYELRYNINILSDSNIQQLSSWTAQTLPKVVGATFNSIVTVAFTYFILYFMLINGRKMDMWLIDWMPLRNENVILLRQETNSLVYSNAIAIPMIALFQGALGLIAYVILGVPEPLFWFVVTCIASMMPVVGASLGYVPVGILLFANGMNVKAIIMLAYGFGVISTVDSVFRFWLQRKIGDVHPLITAFGVIIGLNLFGFIGLIFGPILISLFILIVKIYVKEFGVTKIT